MCRKNVYRKGNQTWQSLQNLTTFFGNTDPHPYPGVKPHPNPLPEFIDPVFAKKAQNARFQWLNTSVLGLFSWPRGSINSDTGVKQNPDTHHNVHSNPHQDKENIVRGNPMLASSKYWPPTPLTARLVCTFCLWGRTHSLVGEGGGGSIFGRRQTQLCTLRMQVICASDEHIWQE